MQNVHFIEQGSFHGRGILLHFIEGSTADPGRCRSLKHTWKLTLWDSVPSCCCAAQPAQHPELMLRTSWKANVLRKFQLKVRALFLVFLVLLVFKFMTLALHPRPHTRSLMDVRTGRCLPLIRRRNGHCGFTTGAHYSGSFSFLLLLPHQAVLRENRSNIKPKTELLQLLLKLSR